MNPSLPSSPEDSLGFLLWSVSKLWQQERQRSLKEIGLSHVEFVLLGHLFWLSMREEHVTQQMLSDWLRIDKASVAAKIPLLEKKGLVRRQPHPTDGRAYCLTATDTGAAAAKAGLRAAKRSNEAFFAPLRGKGEDLKALLQLLLTAHGEVKL